MTAAVLPAQPGEFVVRVDDISQFRSFKKAISMMRGVTKVSLPRRSRKLTAYEESERDIREGRVSEYATVDDFFRKMGV